MDRPLVGDLHQLADRNVHLEPVVGPPDPGEGTVLDGLDPAVAWGLTRGRPGHRLGFLLP